MLYNGLSHVLPAKQDDNWIDEVMLNQGFFLTISVTNLPARIVCLQRCHLNLCIIAFVCFFSLLKT